MSAKQPDPPTLDAYESRHQYHVWCAFCRTWHNHGKGDGHRVAHCFGQGSPYAQTGYILRRAGTWKDRPTRQQLRVRS
mgnify:CR=1 FL=1